MFRYLDAALRIIAIGIAVLIALAIEHPYWAAGVIAFFVAFYYADKGDQKRLAATADLRAMSPTEYEQHCAELLRQAGSAVYRFGMRPRIAVTGLAAQLPKQGVSAATAAVPLRGERPQ